MPDKFALQDESSNRHSRPLRRRAARSSLPSQVANNAEEVAPNMRIRRSARVSVAVASWSHKLRKYDFTILRPRRLVIYQRNN